MIVILKYSQHVMALISQSDVIITPHLLNAKLQRFLLWFMTQSTRLQFENQNFPKSFPTSVDFRCSHKVVTLTRQSSAAARDLDDGICTLPGVAEVIWDKKFTIVTRSIRDRLCENCYGTPIVGVRPTGLSSNYFLLFTELLLLATSAFPKSKVIIL